MTGMALLGLGVAAVAVLLVLVIWVRMPAFVALLLVAVLTAAASGIPLTDAVQSVTKGVGGTLGNVAIVVGLGAMLGKIIEESGGAESIARYFTGKLGPKKVAAAVTIAAFILGIPVFFDVGFIILAPIIFGFASVARLNPLKIG
ncbi:SLC13 family permease, partial [Corynebacterium pyruviciproducens]